MVPDYSSCANSNSEENLKSADILTEDWQFLNKLACLNRICHHPLNANTNARRLSHPAGAAFPHRSISANKQNTVILTQTNVGLLRGLKSLAPLKMSGARRRKSYEWPSLRRTPLR